MQLMFLPFLIHAKMIDVLFQQWGYRPGAVTIIAHEEPPMLALPAPSPQRQGGI